MLQNNSSNRGSIGVAGGRSRAYRPLAEINVTPFVDVMLVLLVVFMITAPLLTSGVSINLPSSEAKPINSDDNKPLEIVINKSGEIYIGDTKVKRQRLVNLLAAMTKNDPERIIFVKADEGLAYGDVMNILGALNGAGFKKVALITDPVKN